MIEESKVETAGFHEDWTFLEEILHCCSWMLMVGIGRLCMAMFSDANFHVSCWSCRVGRICPVPGMLESWLHWAMSSMSSMWRLFEFLFGDLELLFFHINILIY